MPLDGFDWQKFGPTLDPTLTLQQVRSMRTNALWQRALVCPNRIVETNNHNINCTLCDGGGYLYDAGQPAKMLVTGVSVRQMWATQGRVDLGMAMLTTEPETQMSWWDKVTFLETTIRYTECIKHETKDGLTDKLKYAVVDAPELRGVVRCTSSTGTEFTIDTNFTISADGRLVWSTDPGDIFYSVMYLRRPAYIILDLNHHFRSLPAFGQNGINSKGPAKTVEFPVQGLGKLDFLVGDESRVE